MNKTIRRIPALLLFILMIMSLLPMGAMAINPIDVTRDDLSLTICYNYDGKNLSGVSFDLYRVADVDEFANPTLCGDFADYKGAVADKSDAGSWDGLANDLVAYIKANEDIKPLHSDKTGADGKFTVSNLKTGVYLVVGHSVKIDNTKYSCSPFVVFLPDRENGEDSWNYQVTAYPKPDSNSVPTPPPQPSKPPEKRLPQTGLLWWPVPVLVSAGLILILVGLLRQKRDHNEE